MESDGEDMRLLLQETNIESSNNIVPKISAQANVVTKMGLALTNEPNPWILSILLPRETTKSLPNNSDEEILQ